MPTFKSLLMTTTHKKFLQQSAFAIVSVYLPFKNIFGGLITDRLNVDSHNAYLQTPELYLDASLSQNIKDANNSFSKGLVTITDSCKLIEQRAAIFFQSILMK